jgi:hypothetical protein
MNTYVSDSKTTIDVAVEMKIPNLALTGNCYCCVVILLPYGRHPLVRTLIIVAAGLLNAPPSSGHKLAKDFLAPIVGDFVQHTTALFIQIWDHLKATPSSLNWMIYCPGAIIHQVNDTATCPDTNCFGVMCSSDASDVMIAKSSSKANGSTKRFYWILMYL